MTLNEIVDVLAQEALLLDPGNLQACGRLLTLLESIDEPVVVQEKEKLKGYLESMIMKDLDGNAPDVQVVIDTVTELQVKLRDVANGTIATSDSEASETQNGVPEPDASELPQEAEISVDSAAVEEPPVIAAPADFSVEPIEDPELLRDFITEAHEHLDSIEINMVNWEKSPEDKEIINSIFRPFHTIKGVAGFLNLTRVNHLSHQLENLLDEAREGRLQLSTALSDLIFDGVDMLKSMIGTLEMCLESPGCGEYEVDIEVIIPRITAFIEDGGPDEGEEYNGPAETVGEILVKSGKVKPADIEESLNRQLTEEPEKKIGEILVGEKKVSARDVRDALKKQGESGARKATDKYIKVDTSKMDQLLDMVGELVISQTMVTQNPEVLQLQDQRLIRDISQLKRVTSTLQNITMSMRLVPIGATFQKMNRIVRDLARKSGKKINLVLEGESAEIDRNMVDELYDPLVHMVRNSCDHGIKMPDDREAAGKSAEGTVTLRAEHVGGKIVISIIDDGDGLDREVILNKAREKGLIGQDEHPDDKEIFNMVFRAGFSTAQKITDVSGRGVGMDVVRKAIEKLHGTVDIVSERGVGTTFTIKLPLTTAIIDGMIVQVGDERYIIPTLSVRQLMRPTEKDINKVVGRGETVMFRGRLLPLIRLYEIVEAKNAKTNPVEAVLIIVEDGEREVALLADTMLGKQEVVIKTLGETYKDLKGVSGGAILGDGKVGLILDIRAIVNYDIASTLGAV